ncbi:MAG: peptidyl-prolyl cis-trans isomerase, partial [Acidimicrobiaceae bacterium]|nr:peptidyl-prolyl cis-trans isomerase [Acidimicrobiaceae bacterium]
APRPTDLATVRSAYEQYRADFFTQVCVRQQAFSITDASGAIDFRASLNAAQEAAVNGGAGLRGGTVTCYSQSELEAQSKEFAQAVKGLAPGHAGGLQRTAYGYSVLAVESRQSDGFTPAVQRVLGLGTNNGQPFDAALTHVLSQTRVRINPQYGTWREASGGGPPQVTPPRGPADALAALTPNSPTGG